MVSTLLEEMKLTVILRAVRKIAGRNISTILSVQKAYYLERQDDPLEAEAAYDAR